MKRDFYCVPLYLIAALFLCITAHAAPPATQWLSGHFGSAATGSIQSNQQRVIIATENTTGAFGENDSYSFFYRSYPFPYDECSQLTISTRIEKFSTGAAGIMVRERTATNAANVHYEISPAGDLILFWRKANNDITGYTRVGAVGFPAELKLERRGDCYTTFYKKEGTWIQGGLTFASTGANPVVGVYGCAGEDAQIGYTIGGKGRQQFIFSIPELQYKDQFIQPERNYTRKKITDSTVLLMEDFNDGDLSNTPEAVNNPVWSGIKYAYLPRDPSGGRVWEKNGNGQYFLGNKNWGDYEVGLDLSLKPGGDPSAAFQLLLRYQSISIYTKLARWYALTLRPGQPITFEKYESNAQVFSYPIKSPVSGNGTRQRVRVRFLDTRSQVFINDQLVLDQTDTTRPVTYGNIGLKFTNAAMTLDNLVVKKIADPVNGELDNYLLDFYDQPIPSWMSQYPEEMNKRY